MKKCMSFCLIVLFVVAASIIVFPKDSEAIPAFARRVGQACTFCHFKFPKLNEFGITFKNNGYRMSGTPTGNVWELKTVPLAAVIKAQAESTGGENTTNETTLKAEHFEVFLATPIKDHFSVFAEMAHEAGEDDVLFSGNLSADNLTGTLGQLNIKIGNHVMREWDHFTHMRRILSTSYLAQDVVGVFKMFSMSGFKNNSATGVNGNAIEAYGQILAKDKRPTYRYKLGIHSDPDLVRDNKIAGGWGIFTTNYRGHNIGLMYAYAQELEGSIDTKVHRVGANLELNVKKASVILGWNYQKRTDLSMTPGISSTEDAKANNFVAEVLYNVTPKLVVGIREDFVKAEQGSADGDINRLTLGAYQYFMPNVRIGAEYSNEKRDELRPMMGKPMSIGSSATNANQTISTAKVIFELGF